MNTFNLVSCRLGLALAFAAGAPVLMAGEPADPATKAGITAADATAASIAAYRAETTDLRKAAVKASLERLDAEIDLLKAKVGAVADSVRKDELNVRFRALKDRRNELSSEFREARYDALFADVKAEWNKLIN